MKHFKHLYNDMRSLRATNGFPSEFLSDKHMQISHARHFEIKHGLVTLGILLKHKYVRQNFII